MVRMMIMVMRMMIVVRMMVAKKDENLETKILEAAQATRYPPEADQEESMGKVRDWLKHKFKMVKSQ